MKNLLRIRIASSITMLCCILAFTACSQPVKQNSPQSTQQQNGGGNGGNNGGQQNGGGNGGNNGGQQNGGGNGGNNGGQQNGGGNGGNNGGQQNGGEDSSSPTYTVYLRNASTNSAITFWYVKEIDNEDVTSYYSYVRINPGERGYIANIPGNKKYKVNSKVESLSDPSDWTAKAFDELYLDEDKYLVVY